MIFSYIGGELTFVDVAGSAITANCMVVRIVVCSALVFAARTRDLHGGMTIDACFIGLG
jgi:hypothetical protein